MDSKKIVRCGRRQESAQKTASGCSLTAPRPAEHVALTLLADSESVNESTKSRKYCSSSTVEYFLK